MGIFRCHVEFQWCTQISTNWRYTYISYMDPIKMGGGITIPNKHLGYMKNRLVDFLLGVFEHFIFIGRSFFRTWTSPTFSSSHCDSFAMFMRGTCWTKGLGQLLGEENKSTTRNSRSVLESLWDSNKSGSVEFSEVSMFKFSLFFGHLHVQWHLVTFSRKEQLVSTPQKAAFYRENSWLGKWWFTKLKVDGTVTMYWFIFQPCINPPFGDGSAIFGIYFGWNTFLAGCQWKVWVRDPPLKTTSRFQHEFVISVSFAPWSKLLWSKYFSEN